MTSVGDGPTESSTPNIGTSGTAHTDTATTNVGNGTQTQVSSKRPKEYKLKSEVWDHFTKIKREDGKPSDRAKCGYCGNDYSCLSTNGTSAMKKHLLRCSKYPANQDKKQKLLSFKKVDDDDGGDSGCLTSWKFDQEACRVALAEMVIIDECPFKIVERQGFRRFLSILQPKFQLVSRTTLVKDCFQLFTQQRSKLVRMFSKCKSRICLTTDMWTSIQNVSYLCLTAHFIDSNWKLHKRILNFCAVPSHKGKEIGKAIESCLLDWGIIDVCTLTVDNASSNDVAVSYLKDKYKSSLILGGEFFHMRCAAHILNLVVKDGLTEVHDSLGRIRGAVKYVRSSPARAHSFNSCVEKERITCKSSVCLDVPTRWNSIYFMLDATINFQKAFERLDDEDAQFYHDLTNGPHSMGIPTKEDWDNARVMVAFFKKFYDATTIFSGSLYVTSNCYLEQIVDILACLNEWGKNSDPVFQSMGVKMREKFDKYWGDFMSNRVNKLLLLATILDPRRKLKYISFCLNLIYPPEENGSTPSQKAKDATKMIQDVFHSVFDYYEKCDSSAKLSKSQSSFQEVVDESVSQSFVSMGVTKMWEKHIEEEEHVDAKSDLDRYLEDNREKMEPNFDILVWWKMNCGKYPILSKIARDVLAIPISTVASESAFSTGGRVLDQFRSSLTPKIVQCLICTQDWLRSSSTPIEVEEKLDELEVLESSKLFNLNNFFFITIF